MHLAREITVAVVGGLVVLVIGLIVTDDTRTQQVWVYVGSLAVCGLALGAQKLPGFIRRRRNAFKAQVIAAVKNQVLTELESRVPELTQGDSVNPKFVGIMTGNPLLDEVTVLTALLEQGRVLQGGLRSSDISSVVFYGDEAAAVGQWEGRAKAALVHREVFLRDFKNAPPFQDIGISIGDAYRRMETQLEVLERAIQEIDKTNKR